MMVFCDKCFSNFDVREAVYSPLYRRYRCINPDCYGELLEYEDSMPVKTLEGFQRYKKMLGELLDSFVYRKADDDLRHLLIFANNGNILRIRFGIRRFVEEKAMKFADVIMKENGYRYKIIVDYSGTIRFRTYNFCIDLFKNDSELDDYIIHCKDCEPEEYSSIVKVYRLNEDITDMIHMIYG